MSFTPILFDLDGTLADTRPGIALAVGRTLAAFGLPPLHRARIDAFTGRGVEALVQGVLGEVGAPPSLLDRASAVYRGHYAQTCGAGAALYPGIAGLLRRLPPPLAVLSNKPREYTLQVLQALKVAEAFAAVVGGDEPGARLKPDPWPVAEALRRLGPPAPRPLVVGDTENDVKAARAAGVESCAVTWGYGTAAAAASADFRADTVAELEHLLLGRPES